MEMAMRRLHKAIRDRVHPAASRIRRVKAQTRIRPAAKPEDEVALPDLSGLILYGQA
jgi:hypothetical protein